MRALAALVARSPEVRISQLARGLGCPAERVATFPEMAEMLDRLIPSLSSRAEPIVLQIAVEPEATFEP